VAQTHAILVFSVEKTLPDLCAHAPEVQGSEGVLQGWCEDHRLLGATTTPTTLPEWCLGDAAPVDLGAEVGPAPGVPEGPAGNQGEMSVGVHAGRMDSTIQHTRCWWQNEAVGCITPIAYSSLIGLKSGVLIGGESAAWLHERK